jgi:hypothetical protein
MKIIHLESSHEKSSEAIGWSQAEFNFCHNGTSLAAPPITERAMACTIAEQQGHPQGSCWADRLRLPDWLKPIRRERKPLSSNGKKPPADPKKPKTLNK